VACGREVANGQSAVGETDPAVWGEEEAGVVRPPMRHGLAHGEEAGAGVADGLASAEDKTRYTAHGLAEHCAEEAPGDTALARVG
jgi:hypothetical protein